MAARKAKTVAVLPHGDHANVNGRDLTPGVEFTVKGIGRFRFWNTYLPDNSITAYPVGGGGARSFKPDQITRVHRKRTGA